MTYVFEPHLFITYSLASTVFSYPPHPRQVVPVFRIQVVLDTSNRVELRPTIQELFNVIHNVSKELVTVV